MKPTYLLTFFLTAWLSTVAAAEDIDLAGFLAKVRDNHPFFAKEALSPEIEREQQQRFLGEQDWVVTADPRYSHEEHSQGNLLIPETSDQYRLDAAVERLFWGNGSRVSIGYDYTRVDQTFRAPVGVFDQHNNGVTLTYTVPLLKNRGGVVSRLEYELQGYNVDLAKVTSRENQERFLEGLGARFLDWVLLTERRRIAASRLSLAEEELRRTERKRRARLVVEVDVLRARDEVVSARQRLRQVESEWRALQAELAVEARDASLRNAMPRFDLYALATLPDLEQASRKLDERSRLLHAIDLQLARTSHLETGLREEEKPELDLALSSGLLGEDERFSDSLDFNEPRYSVGLRFRYPLGQRTAKADVAKARLQYRQLKEERASVAVQLEAELNNLLVQLHELREVLALNREQIDVARRRTREELRRYEQGRSELTFVIQSRDSEQIAHLSYASNATVYQKLLLRYASLMDSLLDELDRDPTRLPP